jgi:transcriptional regulator GlxA family with amidase domain
VKRKKISPLPGISKAQETCSRLHPGVLRAVNYLQKHFSERVSLQTLAINAHLSRFRLWHLFKEKTGKSPKVYLDLVRVSRAKELLKQEGLNIVEVGRKKRYR